MKEFFVIAIEIMDSYQAVSDPRSGTICEYPTLSSAKQARSEMQENEGLAILRCEVVA